MYERLEPFGEVRADYRAASLGYVMAQGFAALAGSETDFKLDDFLLTQEEAAPEQPRGVDIRKIAALLGAKPAVSREPL